MWPVVLIVFLLAGCATPSAPSGQAALSAHPIAEAGVGITVWKVPVVGIGAWGVGAAPVAIIHQYNYQAVPKPTVGGIPMQPPGPPTPVTPPAEEKKQPEGTEPKVTVPSSAQPPAHPAPVIMQTVIPPAPFVDPTLVIFQNASDDKTFWIVIDGKPEIPEIVLEPRRISSNVYVGVGQHTVRIRGVVPTAQFGLLPIRERLLPLRIDPEGSWQLIILN